ncbi:MAG TPA: DUF6314 family protein [Acidimicrobiales bacterium]|nr:DUF6314 family protein [Acidimicrobiales bacterium]
MLAATCTISDLAAFLGGSWDVERRLVDHAGGATLRFDGTARWRPRAAAELAYDERGVLARADGRDEAWRELRYARLDGGRAEVRYADGRPFHELDLSRGRWRTLVACGRDVYAGLFVVVAPDQLVVRWRVRGPAKAYSSTTCYRRRAGAPSAAHGA